MLPAAQAAGDGTSLGVTRDASVITVAGGGGTFAALGSTSYPSTTAQGLTSLRIRSSDTLSLATGVSSDGSAVAGGSGNYTTTGQAFLWTAGTGTVGLGYLPGDNSSMAYGISANGKVVVGISGQVSYTMASSQQAFLWTAATGMVGLGYIPGDSWSAASAVSADGAVVVGESMGATIDQAFRWTAATGMVGLGHFRFDYWSAAYGVSADGSVVVGESMGATTDQAFRWTAATGMIGLGYLSAANPASWANAVSADGLVVVGASYTDSGGQEAFRWSAATGMTGLGHLPGSHYGGGLLFSEALGISGNGLVIVGWSDTDGPMKAVNLNRTPFTTAFRWTSQTGMESVAGWLADNGRPVTGWRLSVATGANWDGSTIVGYGIDPQGNIEAWIARVADTSSGLLGLGDAANSLATTINLPAMGNMLANAALHGAHGHPGGARLVSGKLCTWAAGDWGRNDVYKSDIGLIEAGLCAMPFDALPDTQFGIGAGKTWGTQSLAYGGNVNADGEYIVGDIDTRVGHTPFWATLTGLYGWTDETVRRGYYNGGSLDSSKGQLPLQTAAVRLRGEARQIWHTDKVAVTPYMDFSVISTTADSYSESGGGFPASYNQRSDNAYYLRYGINGTYTFNAKTMIIGGIEGVHRFGGTGSGVSGDMIGLFNFSLPGTSFSNDWVRVTAGVDQRLGPGVLYANVAVASRGEDPTYMIAAGYRAAW
jgi:probable HAF family extracellular repeat protein